MNSGDSSMSRQRMAAIWARFAEIYGHKWTSQYGEKHSEAWAAGLSDLNLEQIANGFRWCIKNREDAWPPSLPEFRSACFANGVEGYPTGETAYRQGMAYARAKQFGGEVPETLPGIREACRQATSRALVSTQQDESRKLFAYHYEQVLKALSSGEILPPEPPKALVTKVQVSAPEEVSEWCGKLRGLLK